MQLIGFTQCDRTNLYGANTTVKNYDCRITDPGLQNVVQQGVTLTVNLTSRDTTVSFRAADNSTTPVFCTASDCTVTAGTTAFACARTHCDCGNAAVSMTSCWMDLRGRPCGFDRVNAFGIPPF